MKLSILFDFQSCFVEIRRIETNSEKSYTLVLAVADKNFDEYSNQNCYAQIQANIRMPAHDNDKMHTVSSSYCNLNHMRHTISPLHWAFCKSEREILLNEFDIYLVYRTVVVWNQLLSFFAMLTCG
jgi:hypothetical protein